MSLKELFLSKVASVRDLGHRAGKVTKTIAIVKKCNDCVYSKLRDKLTPPRLEVGEVKEGDVNIIYFLWLYRCMRLDFGELAGYLWNSASQQSL